MNYEESLEYIKKTGWNGIRLGLERITKLMDLMGNPQDELDFVHVAGTNGKGTACAVTSYILKEAGYKVGLFTSPFIRRFNERIQINNEEITDQALSEATSYVKSFADKLEDCPTEFELNTAIAFYYFAKEKCDIVVLEVGMGGEFDSTNIIKNPDVCVLTSIGLDHVKELGPTVRDIARTKSKIIKAGAKVVADDSNPEAFEVIEERCKELGITPERPKYGRLRLEKADFDGSEFVYTGIGRMHTSLVGEHQLRNIAMAIEIIEALRDKGYIISPQNVMDGVKNAKWIGRFQPIYKNPRVIVDGAHNSHGMRVVMKSLAEFAKGRKCRFVFGVMADKDVSEIADVFLPYAKKVYAVKPGNPRAMDEKELAALINEKQAGLAQAYDSVAAGVQAAIEQAKAEGDDEIVMCFGSLYMINDVMEVVEKQ